MKCECKQSGGWCEAHKRVMSKRQFAACRQGVFDGRATGLGDVVEKVTRATGIQKAAKFVAKITGKPCGCAGRQDKLNDLLPFHSAGITSSSDTQIVSSDASSTGASS